MKETTGRRAIAVVIPVFNNRDTILDVIEGVLEYCADVIVVNDGSTDGTGDLLKNNGRITLISYETNRGKGFALKCGIRAARQMGFSYVITMDADMQHLPQEIPSLVAANIAHPGSVIIGKRKNLDKVRRTKGASFANAFSNFWFCFQTFHHVSDTQSGFRLYPIRKARWLGLLTSRYEAELEMLVMYAWSGVDIYEIPVEVFYPEPSKRKSSFRPVSDFVRISVMNTVVSLLALVIGWPLTIIGKIFFLLRSLYAYLIYAIFTIAVMTPIALFYVVTGKYKGKLRKLLWFTCRIETVHGLVPSVKPTYHNPTGETFEKPAVIISNHQSAFDLISIISLTPKEVILTNDWVWNNPYYGYVIRHADYYPVSEGLESIIPKLRSLFDEGVSAVIFPEGTRSRDMSIGRFHSGAFAIADALGADIIPVVVHGTQKVFPIHARLLHRGNVCIEIDRRISHDEYMALGSYREIASYFRKYYKKRYEQVRDREDRYV